MRFCFAPFCSKKKRKGCFSKQTKVKTHFLRRSEKSQTWKWKRRWKNNFWDFFKKPERNSEKNKITRLEQAKKRKKRNQKGEEKLKVFYRKRWRKEVKKDTKKKHEWRSCKKILKGEKRYFWRNQRCLATKKSRVTMRRRGHWEWTSGGYIQGEETWKESQHMEKKKRET